MVALRRSRAGPPVALLVLVLLVGAGRPLAAQDYPPLVVEARAGAAVPILSFRTGPDRGGDIERAPTFGLHFVYRGPSGWGPYIGFSQHRFDCGADGCPGTEYVATMWDTGMQRTLGFNGPAWVRLGVLFGRLEREFAAAAGSVRQTSMLSLGLEAGAGFRVPIRGRLSLTPGARYDWLNTKFRDGPLVHMRWVTADVGLALGF
jgi:hypothetical protein